MLSWYLCQAISDVKREVSQLDASPGVGTARRLREAICKTIKNSKTAKQSAISKPGSAKSKQMRGGNSKEGSAESREEGGEGKKNGGAESKHEDWWP